MATEATLDLYLDPTLHDLEVEDADLRLVAGVDAVAQGLRVGLKLFYGEWYLVREAGIPYWRSILVSAPRSRLVESLFRKDIASDDQVEAIKSFTFTRETATRKASVTFTASSAEGEVKVSEVFP